MPEGLPADGREGFLSAGRTSGRGPPSGFTVGLVGPADGLVVVDDGLAVLPDGLVVVPVGLVELVDGLVAVPEGLVVLAEGLAVLPDGLAELVDGRVAVPEGLVASLFEEPEDREYDEPDDCLDTEDEDDGLEPRDCASISNG